MGMTVNAMAGMQAASETVSDYSVTAKAAETSEKKASAETEKDAVYEKSAQESAKAPYSINKMSKEDRAALVKQLKADQESRQNSLTNLVSQMLGKQPGMYGVWTLTISIFMCCIRILHQSHSAACSGMHWRGRNTGAGVRTIRTWQFTITPRTSHADLWSI